MKMIAAAFLLLGFVTVSMQSGLDLYQLQELVNTVKHDLADTALLISDAKTLCAVGDEDINYINDFFLPHIKVVNEQQNELIDVYGAQIKSLQHRIDDAKAREKAATSLAKATHTTLKSQLFAFLNGTILAKDNQQSAAIRSLRWNLTTFKESFLDDLNSTIINLDESERDNSDKIDRLDDAVDSRRCEYGFIFVPIGEYRRVDFKTEFDHPPNVTLAMPGFVAHLDRYKTGNYDILELNKKLGEVYTTHFELDAEDHSQGQVEVKYVACSWMACQNMAREVDH